VPNRKFVAIGFLAMANLMAPWAFGTTVVSIVTPHGVLIGSDAKQVTTGADRVPTGSRLVPTKIELVKNRILVATAGLVNTDGYRFNDWITQISNKVSNDISVDDFASALKRESANKFRNFKSEFLDSKKLTRPRFTSPCYAVFQYLVAGYESGHARVYEIDFFVDWGHNILIGPEMNPVSTPIDDVFSLHTMGDNVALKEIANENSYVHTQALKIAPDVFGKIFSSKEITECEAVSAMRALIRIQGTVTPSTVGGLGRFYYIPTSGNAYETKCNLASHRTSEDTKKQ
jgi:hypothetical protein